MQPIAAPLLQWFQANKRLLPFRQEPSAYHIWVSEIMLQQTRVAAAIPYYNRFIAALPTPADLAVCEPDALRKLWQGLGYYNRVNNMQKAARIVCEQYGGDLPADYDALRSLPGIGDYTAGAIASIAFGIPAPAVDGNVLRVAARLTGDSRNVLETKVRAVFRQAMADTMPQDRPGDFNQALMDLGAAVCLPNGKPLCDRCPAAGFCTAKRDGKQALLPVREKKKEKREVRLTLFIMKKEDGTAALRQRPDTGLLAGLWEFPHVEGELDEAAAAAQLAEWHVTPLRWEKILHAKHEFTHLRWRMTGYLLTAAGEGEPDWLWADAAARQQRAIPSAFQVFTAALDGSTAEE